jgi:hypothetical protein
MSLRQIRKNLMIKKIIPHCEILEKPGEGGTCPSEKEQKQQVRVMI